jgi:hypothetical protein
MNTKHPSAPRGITQVRPQTMRQQPNAPRMVSDRFGYNTQQVVHEHWEATPEIRWFNTPIDSNGYQNPPRLQQRWLCKQKSNSRSRPVEIRMEWRDVEIFTEEAPMGPSNQ